MIKISPNGTGIRDEEMLAIFKKYGAERESVFRRYEMNEVIKYTGGIGVDVGCGLNKIHSSAIGIDKRLSEKDYGYPFGAQIKADGSALPWFQNASLDYVFSSHCLEHFKETTSVLSEWNRVLKPGGQLVMIIPDKRRYPNVGTRNANPDHKHDFEPEDATKAVRDAGSFRLIQLDTLYEKLKGNAWSILEAPKYSHKDLNFSFEVVARKM